MSGPNEQNEILNYLKELANKQEVPKKKDFWDKLPTVTTFLGTAVIGVLTLVLTQSYQHLESNRLSSGLSMKLETKCRNNFEYRIEARDSLA